MNLLLDENIDRPIGRWLRKQGHDVVELAAAAPGASDPDVIRMSREENRILITFDRDIGRIVLAQRASHPGVVYLRLRAAGPDLWQLFAELWPRIEPIAPHHLVTVRNRQIRRRPLPKENDQ